MNDATNPHVFEVRPRFQLTSQKSVEHICQAFEHQFAMDEHPYHGRVRHGYVSIFPNAAERHFWSPHLSIALDQRGVGLTQIDGLYGPSPEVWTMFVFFYGIVGLSIVIVSVIGFANRSLGESSVILWVIPLLIILFCSMYAVSYFGQRKGHEQVEGMYAFMLEVVKS